MNVINLCPHAIHLYDGTLVCNYPPSGAVARCEEMTSPVYHLDATLPVVNKTYGEIIGLPAPKEGTVYIVSMLIRTLCPGRSDLLSPGDAVRDAEGKIIGCTNFVANAI